MTDNREAQRSEINKKMLQAQLIGAPGSILFGLGLYGVFAVNGDAFISFLNEIENSYALLGIGGALMVWQFVTVIKLSIKRAKLGLQD
ncbi:hypothetical protein [Pseudoalteromonas sp. T1lg75]|uniref:hypothetical protein n=1 Tax=Pseudoalteromonas sp. T1lg75 TaxID=2077102 RepID=UPI000CF676A6|nr:hypothetical protein [Pseudoalteromonas sp. T1lg75]